MADVNLNASLVPALNSIMWVSAIVPLMFLIPRCYIRVRMRQAFGLDDSLAIAANAILIGYAAATSYGTIHGLGRHIAWVMQKDPTMLVEAGLMAHIGQTLAIMSCTLGKTSFAVTLLRIVVQDWLKWALWFVIITLNIVNLLAAIFVFVQCKDPRALWNTSIKSECWPTNVFTNFSLFVGTYSGFVDFLLAIVPWIVVLRLNMPKREKLAITFAMSLGVFAGATAMVKVSYLPNLSAKSDFTWALPPLLWWAAAEDGLTIVACSIPVLRPLFSMVLGTVTRSGTPDALSGPTYASGKGSKSNRSNRVPEPLTELRTPFDGKNSTLIEMSPRDPTDHPFGDERSDKSILYDTEPGKEGGAKRWSRRQNGINCTKSVSVGYSNKE